MKFASKDQHIQRLCLLNHALRKRDMRRDESELSRNFALYELPHGKPQRIGN